MTRRYAKGSPERKPLEAAHIDCGQKCGQIDLDLLAAIDERDAEIGRLRLAMWLVDDGVLFCDEDLELSINVNDTFAPAADCEGVTLDDIPAVADAYRRFGIEGVIAWVALRRGQEPMSCPCHTNEKFQEAYQKAKAALTPEADDEPS